MISTGNPIVDKMQTFNASGNIIPPQWFKTIVRANGKPNLNAIVILSDVVYWYKPRIVRDEVTGMVKSIEKRFKADLLQRNYQQYADQFGISKREATNAIVELEKLGVVKRHLRNIQANGMTLTNVLFLELISDKVFELTFESQVAVSQSDTSHFEKGHPPTLKSDTPNFEKGDGITPKRETYTEITTKTTTEITNNNKKEKVPTSPKVDTKRIAEQFDTLWTLYPKGRKQGKEVAKKAFIKAIKDGVEYDTIKTALLAYNKQIEIHKTDTQFIKMGSTWFRQKCWEDEYEEVSQSNGYYGSRGALI